MSYWVSGKRRAANAFLIARPSRRRGTKYSLGVVVHHVGASAHHHLVWVWRASFPSVGAAAAEFLRRRLNRRWHGLGTRREGLFV